MKSLFITFEGGEGAGKSTQIQLLKERLENTGHPVVMTREPGGTPKAEEIRQLILSGQIKHMGPYSEALMFFIARQNHVEHLIQPALNNGMIVLCDRFSDSTLVYQGMANNLDIQELKRIEKTVVGDIQPDLTFILDIPAEIGIARARRRQQVSATETDRFEAEDLAFHEGLRQGFFKLAKEDKKRYIPVNATQSESEIADIIWHRVQDYL